MATETRRWRRWGRGRAWRWTEAVWNRTGVKVTRASVSVGRWYREARTGRRWTRWGGGRRWWWWRIIIWAVVLIGWLGVGGLIVVCFGCGVRSWAFCRQRLRANTEIGWHQKRTWLRLIDSSTRIYWASSLSGYKLRLLLGTTLWSRTHRLGLLIIGFRLALSLGFGQSMSLSLGAENLCNRITTTNLKSFRIETLVILNRIIWPSLFKFLKREKQPISIDL